MIRRSLVAYILATLGMNEGYAPLPPAILALQFSIRRAAMLPLNGLDQGQLPQATVSDVAARGTAINQRDNGSRIAVVSHLYAQARMKATVFEQVARR